MGTHSGDEPPDRIHQSLSAIERLMSSPTFAGYGQGQLLEELDRVGVGIHATDGQVGTGQTVLRFCQGATAEEIYAIVRRVDAGAMLTHDVALTFGVVMRREGMTAEREPF